MEAKVNARNLRISMKESYEVCNLIRNKTAEKAKSILNDVINMKSAVPYKRYLRDTPHRAGNMAAGRYPIKACTEILKLIKSAEANAQNKGLSQNLIISHISAHKGSKQFHFGSKRRTLMKNTHIDLVVKNIGTKEIKKW